MLSALSSASTNVEYAPIKVRQLNIIFRLTRPVQLYNLNMYALKLPISSRARSCLGVLYDRDNNCVAVFC